MRKSTQRTDMNDPLHNKGYVFTDVVRKTLMNCGPKEGRAQPRVTASVFRPPALMAQGPEGPLRQGALGMGTLHLLPGGHFLGQPKAKGEHVSVKQLPARYVFVRTIPPVEADAKDTQGKHCHPQTKWCARPAGLQRWPGTVEGRRQWLGQGGSCGEVCGFGQTAGNVIDLRHMAPTSSAPPGL